MLVKLEGLGVGAVSEGQGSSQVESPFAGLATGVGTQGGRRPARLRC